MKKNIKLALQWTFHFSFFLIFTLAFSLACINFFVEGLEFEQEQVNAGDELIIYLNGKIAPADDSSLGGGATESQLVVAICVPTIWDAIGSLQMSYTNIGPDDANYIEPGETRAMIPIPANEHPKTDPDYTWSQSLMRKCGVGPNRRDDMEWIAFRSVESVVHAKGNPMDLRITIKLKTTGENVRVKLGFVVNNTGQGMNIESAYNYFRLFWSKCYEIVNGEGAVVDFCDFKPGYVLPSNATNNDIIMIKYAGGVMDNDPLVNSNQIFVNVVAHTQNGNTIEKNNVLIREDVMGIFYSCALWPTEYFGISNNDRIISLEYFFINDKGSTLLDPVYETIITEDPEDPDHPIEEEIIVGYQPFKYDFSCR